MCCLLIKTVSIFPSHTLNLNWKMCKHIAGMSAYAGLSISRASSVFYFHIILHLPKYSTWRYKMYLYPLFSFTQMVWFAHVKKKINNMGHKYFRLGLIVLHFNFKFINKNQKAVCTWLIRWL